MHKRHIVPPVDNRLKPILVTVKCVPAGPPIVARGVIVVGRDNAAECRSDRDYWIDVNGRDNARLGFGLIETMEREGEGEGEVCRPIGLRIKVLFRISIILGRGLFFFARRKRIAILTRTDSCTVGM